MNDEQANENRPVDRPDSGDRRAEELYAHSVATPDASEPSTFAKKRAHAKQVAYEKTPSRFKNASSFQVRFRTGLVYTAVSIVAVLVNDLTTTLYLALVAGICAGEFCYMMRVDAKLPNEMIGVVGAAAYPVAM